MAEERRDDFQERRKHLANLSDEELKQRFWELAGKIVDPMVDLSKKHTSPSIERSVLLRMGLSSLEAKDLVQKINEKELLGKGAGHIVWRIAKDNNIGIREAGQALIEGNYWDDVESIFGGGGK